jgi:hypothetical protein
LFGVDRASGDIVRIGGDGGDPSPNGGVLTTVLEADLTLADASFDVGPDGALTILALDVAGDATWVQVTLGGIFGAGDAATTLERAPPEGLVLFARTSE